VAGDLSRDAKPRYGRNWATFCLDGFLGRAGRDSVRPMVVLLSLAGNEQVRSFSASTNCNDGLVYTALTHGADPLIGGQGALVIIDDVAPLRRSALQALAVRLHTVCTAGC